jgi:hypothetical protein
MSSHMFLSSRPRLPNEMGSDATTHPMAPNPDSRLEEGFGADMCPVALDLTSLMGRALTLPHAPWLQTPPLR